MITRVAHGELEPESANRSVEALAIQKRFGERNVLRGLDLHVEGREVVALLGPNGAGKTTLIRILSTLVLPDAGQASVGGFDVVARPREARACIGLVIGDERAWYWRLSGIDNLAFFGVLTGLDRREARRRGAELMDEFGLHDVGRKRVGRFSAGMRARLGLARALIADPPVLILDEATRSIDPLGSLEFRDKVRALADGGKAVLMATHDLHEAAVADRVLVMGAGRIVEEVPGGSVDRVETAVRRAASA